MLQKKERLLKDIRRACLAQHPVSRSILALNVEMPISLVVCLFAGMPSHLQTIVFRLMSVRHFIYTLANIGKSDCADPLPK